MIDVFHISTIHIDNLGTQVREMFIDEEKIEVWAHTKYIYDMTFNEIDTTIAVDSIIDVAVSVKNKDYKKMTITTSDDTYDFYFENLNEVFAVYQKITNILEK